MSTMNWEDLLPKLKASFESHASGQHIRLVTVAPHDNFLRDTLRALELAPVTCYSFGVDVFELPSRLAAEVVQELWYHAVDEMVGIVETMTLERTMRYLCAVAWEDSDALGLTG